jgi:hypothetical protein
VSTERSPTDISRDTLRRVSGYRTPGVVARPKVGPYKELAAIAAAFDVPHAGAPAIEIEFAGARIAIELSLNSGTVDGATFQVMGRWPSVCLRKELDEDRESKARGITRELQTGDPAFDQQVFVESDEPDALLRRLLSDGKRRRAVITLLRHSSVTFGERGISIRVTEGKIFDPDWVRTHVLTHLRAAAEGPPLSPTGAATPNERTVEVLVIVAFGALLVAFVACVTIPWTRERFVLALAGTAIGIVAFAPLRLLVLRGVRGHSRSQDQHVSASMSLMVLLVSVGAMAPLLLNAVVDAERRPVRGEVDMLVGTEDDGPGVLVRARWADGSDDLVMLPEGTRIGDVVIGTQRRGLFGWTWTQRGAVRREPR